MNRWGQTRCTPLNVLHPQYTDYEGLAMVDFLLF